MPHHWGLHSLLFSKNGVRFTIADKLVPAIKDNLMDKNGRDRNVSIFHNYHILERVFLGLFSRLLLGHCSL